MKPLVRCFGIFIRQIVRDSIFWAVCLAPLLTAVVFRFGLPFLETLLRDFFQKQSILADYYLIFDLWLCLTPSYMLCFASAMLLLTERDENIACYMAVTPVGKMGYMLSRLIFPAVIAFFFSFLLTYFFALASWNLLKLMTVSLLMGVSSAAAMFFIVSFSSNRVEGMAVAKMASLIFLGLVVPFFVTSGTQYLAAILPTFWIGKLCKEDNILFVFPALALSVVWIGMFIRRFMVKLH